MTMMRVRGRFSTKLAALAIMGVSSAAMAALDARAQQGAQGCDPGEIRIRFSHDAPPDGPEGVAAQRLTLLVNERLNGELCMELFPGGALFDDETALAALKRGEVELVAMDTDKLDETWPPIQVFNLPFLFRDINAVQWFQNSGPGVRLRRELQTVGYVGLAYWNDGMIQLSATRPLLRPDDLKGLTVVAGDEGLDEVAAAMYRLLGAKGSAMEHDEVHDALKAGAAQAQESTWFNYDHEKLYEVQDGLTETNHSAQIHILLTSDKFWSSLPAATRGVLSQTIAFATAEQNAAAQESERISILDVQQRGAPIRKLDEAARTLWAASVRPVWEKFRGVIGSEYLDAAQRANR